MESLQVSTKVDDYLFRANLRLFDYYRAQVETSVDKYIENNYRSGTTRAALTFNQQGNLQIDISCINLKLDHFWGGEWQASWQVDTQTSQLSGSIHINNHYFEIGNVQFKLDKEFDAIPLEVADGEHIVEAIKKAETDFQMAIENMHEQTTDVFKRVRRILPVTGQKFNWEKPKTIYN